MNPELAEQLMITFKSLNSNSDEELSHSLTTCRRMIENFADIVYPPREELHKGRKVGKSQYINRLWAFIDSVVESDTNKLLAQSHLEYLGKYLESIHKLSNKGVHAKLAKLEAIKTVFHLYLVFADLLDYLDFEVISSDKIDINKASIDELEVLGNINRNIAKEIFKTRITIGNLNEEILLSVKGMGKKTLESLKENFQV
ncbi:ComEA family DNA-binding protein [Bernardetia sp. OM2101]|uniref:ComEA family DNA-binding protein n=1 Tax=Bernardetia sp. OM2101 TaxID=3344876 RepID=UPI0035CEC270